MSDPENTLFLLVGNAAEAQWLSVLQNALAPLGELMVLSEEEVVDTVTEISFSVIIIDAGAVYDAALLTRRLRVIKPEGRIMVVTASPTWEYARQTLQAGAADYIRKTFNQEELRAKIMEVMKTPPSKRLI
jgi:DNA-binding response OmpR family regulator